MKIFSSTPISVCSLHSSSTADSCCCWGGSTADAALRRRSLSALPQIFTVCAGENVGPASTHIRQRHGLRLCTPFTFVGHYNVKLVLHIAFSEVLQRSRCLSSRSSKTRLTSSGSRSAFNSEVLGLITCLQCYWSSIQFLTISCRSSSGGGGRARLITSPARGWSSRTRINTIHPSTGETSNVKKFRYFS